MRFHYWPTGETTMTSCGRSVLTGSLNTSQIAAEVNCKPCLSAMVDQAIEENPDSEERCDSWSKSGQQCLETGEHDVHSNGTRSWVTISKPKAGTAYGCGNGSCPQHYADGSPFDRHHELDCPDDFTRLVTNALLDAGASRGASYRGLDQIGKLTRAIEQLEEARRLVIDRSRDEGHSWPAIAGELGISKQGAQQRYGRKPTGPAPERETTLPGL